MIFKKVLKTVLARRVIETEVTSRSAFIANYFALKHQKQLKISKRTVLQDSLLSLYLTIKSQAPTAAYMGSSALSQCYQFFGHFLLLSERKNKFIKLCTKFQVKQRKCFPCSCTSIMLCNKPGKRKCLRFWKILQKNAHSKVKETKLTSSKAVIINISSIASKNQSENETNAYLLRLPAQF